MADKRGAGKISGTVRKAIQRRMKQIDEAAETISVDTDDASPFDSV
jgi:hypothetical protein